VTSRKLKPFTLSNTRQTIPTTNSTSKKKTSSVFQGIASRRNAAGRVADTVVAGVDMGDRLSVEGRDGH
jgi:hypothetical protein